MFIFEHSIDLKTDGTSFILRDITQESDYISESIDVTTDIVSAIFTLKDSNDNEYTIDITTDYPYLREYSGYNITTTMLNYDKEFFSDGLYYGTLTVIEDSSGVNNELYSESTIIFLSQILQVVSSQIIDADWKELYNPHVKSISSDLRKRHYLIGIMYSIQAGLINNAEAQRLVLNKLCDYVE
jgi:hypothetical protein